MKLNIDCIRDVLLYLEENLTYNHDDSYSLEHNAITIHKIAEDLHQQKNYDIDDVNYSVEKMIEANFLIPQSITRGRNNSILYCPIADISYEGHHFLNTVRPLNVWDKTKQVASKIGNYTLGFLESVAHDIAVESAKQAVTIMMTGNQSQ